MSTIEPLYLVDMGSTRCRVWLTENGRCWARASADFGVRDVAKSLPVPVLRERLDRLMAEVGQIGLQAGIPTLPRYGIGAGMITSAQGLLEIPHVAAPAAIIDLARPMQAIRVGASCDVTLFLVPGVKTAARGSDVESALLSDMMRGEEALCIGLLAAGHARAPGAVLNLGSHWKWIFVDREGRIAGSRSSLTGEIIHAVQSQTLLASGLPQMRPTSLDPEWFALGRREYRRSGVTRALFCIRLLEQAEQGDESQRLAFLYGVFLQADLEAFQSNDAGRELREVSLVGPASLASAWQRMLSESDLRVTVVSEEQRDDAFLQGLTTIYEVARREGLLPSAP
jgi:2-dehydro-3-deoxygalactonokinase